MDAKFSPIVEQRDATNSQSVTSSRDSAGAAIHSRLTLRKAEILRGYDSFSMVLSKGRSLQAGNVRCFFLESPSSEKIQVGFSVGRGIRRSSSRNRLKRLLRESYRRNKNLLLETQKSAEDGVKLVFLFMARKGTNPQKVLLAEVDQDLKTLLSRLSSRLLRE